MRAGRGISTIVGAIIAIPVLVALLLAALYAGSALTASMALYAQRVQESISLIPIVNSTGVYADVVNSGSQAARVLYVVSRNLTEGTLTVIPVNASLDPGDSVTVRLAATASGSGRLAAYAVTARGGVYPWDPRYTLDGVLDLPQEPLQVGGGLGEDVLATIWLAQVLGPDYPGICSLETVYVNPNVSMDIPYIGAYAEGLYYVWWNMYWAEASATVDGVSRRSYDYFPPAEAWARVSRATPAASLGPVNLTLLLEAEAWGYADSAGASAWAAANAVLVLEPQAGYAVVVVTRPAVAGGASVQTVNLGGYEYSVVVAQPGSPASLQLSYNYSRTDSRPVNGLAYAYAEATLPSSLRLNDFIDYLAVYVYKCP